MNQKLNQLTPPIFAVLRIVAGIMFAMHGSQKLLGIPGDKDPVEIVSMMGLAGAIELVGGLLIAIGLFTTIAAFIASAEMIVAFFMAHIPQGILPILNGGELALLYFFLFLYIAVHGAGIWSIDASRHKTKRM